MLVTSLRQLRRRRRRGQLSLGGITSGCCCAATKICVTVCNSGIILDGATVTVTGLGSCTTDATGCCDAPWLTSGSHAYTVADAHGGTIFTGTKTWTAGATNNIQGFSPTSGKCCNAYYVPNVLTATDAVGTLAMSFTGTDSLGNPQWQGGRQVSKTSCAVTTPSGSCTVAAPTTGPVAVCYTLTCDTTGGPPVFTLVRTWAYISSVSFGTQYYQDSLASRGAGTCTPDPPFQCGSPLTNTSSGSSSSGANDPFAVSFTVTQDPGASMPDPVGGNVAISQ